MTDMERVRVDAWYHHKPDGWDSQAHREITHAIRSCDPMVVVSDEEARVIILALEKAGLVVVPRNATSEMLAAAVEASAKFFTSDPAVEFAAGYKAMIERALA